MKVWSSQLKVTLPVGKYAPMPLTVAVSSTVPLPLSSALAVTVGAALPMVKLPAFCQIAV